VILKAFADHDYTVAPLDGDDDDDDSKPPLPVLLVGAPRSGATLLEAALSRAPGVGVRQIDGALGDAVSKVGVAAFEPATRDQALVDQVGAEYVASVRRAARVLADDENTTTPEKVKVMVDPLVDNVFWAGAAVEALKGRARVIVVRRQNVDATAFSIYKTFFSQNGREWTYEPVSIRARLVAVRRLEQLWLDKLGDAVITVEYEKLVNDPQAELTRVLTWLGLDFSPDCLQPHLSPYALPTPHATAGALRQPGFRAPRHWLEYVPRLVKRIEQDSPTPPKQTPPDDDDDDDDDDDAEEDDAEEEDNSASPPAAANDGGEEL